MTIPRNLYGLATAATLIVGVSLVAGGQEARGQSVAAPNSWVTYAPAPAQTAPTAVAPAAPAATAVAPGWQGYAPATAWTPYQPQTSWRYYAPQQGWVAAPAARSVARSSAPIGPRNREYGTGRNVHMHKPWLPSHP